MYENPNIKIDRQNIPTYVSSEPSVFITKCSISEFNRPQLTILNLTFVISLITSVATLHKFS